MSISLSAVNNFLCGTRCMAGDLTVDRSGGGNGTTTVTLCDTRTNRTNGTMGAALAQMVGALPPGPMYDGTYNNFNAAACPSEAPAGSLRVHPSCSPPLADRRSPSASRTA